jgi:hypothetical protein
MVEFADGLPNVSPKPSISYRNIRLGKVLVSIPGNFSDGVMQYDIRSDIESGFSLRS